MIHSQKYEVSMKNLGKKIHVIQFQLEKRKKEQLDEMFFGEPKNGYFMASIRFLLLLLLLGLFFFFLVAPFFKGWGETLTLTLTWTKVTETPPTKKQHHNQQSNVFESAYVEPPLSPCLHCYFRDNELLELIRNWESSFVK